MIGLSVLHKNSLRRDLAVLHEFDWGAKRHELLTGGQTITGQPTVDVMLADAASTDLSVSGITLDGTSKKVQCKVTVAATAVIGETYQLVCTVVLSGGATLTEHIDVRIEE